ncbi:Txe/YoeB family addiction module toxin [Dyadobacter sp. Leaf189]|uniref:Txe/YoeB family addiction module toxin n=1 Tax=Dyadobacter sp. Leaf189 TaxID=1736295 RepID=UPI0006FB9566|nr:Txe/YoeB family addiction module toxin [Dyadobacter sp. Leaf189]KQS33382.1 txe/YoeB family addiction module toxin [Dyadobacter sp. Leaf189]
MYKIVLSKRAEQDLYNLLKSEPKVYKKAVLLLKEIEQHPRTGRGKPTLKGYGLAGLYARKLTDKHRLVYSVNDDIITVDILSARGHYDDK